MIAITLFFMARCVTFLYNGVENRHENIPERRFKFTEMVTLLVPKAGTRRN